MIINPTLSAATGASRFTLVPIARPAARAATNSAPVDWRAQSPAPVVLALTRSATHASRKNVLAVSDGALPACVAIIPESRTKAVPISVAGASPYGLPMHHPASNANASQPRLTSVERKSLPVASIPTACSNSEFCG